MVSPKKTAFQTIAKFDRIFEAHIAKGKLESEGVEVFMDDNNVLSINSLYTHAVGGVKLRVHTQDAERATEILDNLEEQDPEALAELAASHPEPDPLPHCPRCESEHVSYEHISKKFTFLGSLLFSIPFPFINRHRWKCRTCAHRWKGLPPTRHWST
jgi:hypothetical protein